MNAARGENRERLMAALSLSPGGMTNAEAAARFGWRRQSAADATKLALRAKLIVAREEIGVGGIFHRYFLVALAPPDALVTSEYIRPPATQKPKYKGSTFVGEVRVLGGCKVTIAPPFVDRRFTSDGAESFFAALGPGRYMGD